MAPHHSLGCLWIMLVVTCLPGALEKCIFDEVQQSVTVVTTSTDPQRANRKLRELSPTTHPPQPIRIHTWVPRESPTLSEVERERLEPSVREAVAIVSSILSVNRVPGRFLLSRDIYKYCKFLWRNATAVNYNRCGRANEKYRSETCLDVVIPDDHLSGCAVYPEPNAPTVTVLRSEGPGLPDTDFLLYLHTQSTDKCRAEVRGHYIM
ncbi:leishmanolysin-like peptidase 2 [Esox lucius]|uniref:leishmanolysin-like peptidase 2 n=1 Tax=Esox lucius TaxID=8010 RepID=UPI001476A2B7|nr:leishmanolysin-like peptidase 2 [Esox lucius]